MDALVTLVQAYEAQHFPIGDPDPIEAIRERMEDLQFDRKEMEELIGPRGRVSEILNRKRPLTISMIRRIHQAMRIPAVWASPRRVWRLCCRIPLPLLTPRQLSASREAISRIASRPTPRLAVYSPRRLKASFWEEISKTVMMEGMHRFICLFVFVACQCVLQASQKQADCAPVELTAGSPSPSGIADGTPQDGLRPLAVVSLNMAGKTDWEVVRAGFESVQQVPQADIYLLQEFIKDSSSLLETASKSLGYHYMFSGTEKCGDECLKGVAILSRFPLLDQGVLELPRNNLVYNLRCRIALGATAQTQLGPVRIYSLHLDTRINSRRRVRQLGPVIEEAAKFRGPALIAGDFNTANVLYIRSVVPIPFLQLQVRAVRKAMKASGFYTPFLKTPRTFSFPPLRLDFIYLKGLLTNQRGVADIEFSDHKALWALLGKDD